MTKDHIISDDKEQVTVFIAAEPGEPLLETADGKSVIIEPMEVPEDYEYAGFRYQVLNTRHGETFMVPYQGQHAAAWKGVHMRAARDMYLQEKKAK